MIKTLSNFPDIRSNARSFIRLLSKFLSKETRLRMAKSVEKSSKKQSPMQQQLSKIAEVYVISNGYLSTPKSLMIAFDQRRILVNCGEGTQRLINSHLLKLTKIDTILLTRFEWSCIGGLRGVSMGMLEQSSHPDSQQKKPSVLVHSPVDLNLGDRQRSFKKYLFEKKLTLDQFDCCGSGDYTDVDFSIKRIEMTQNKRVWSYFLRIEKPLANIDSEKLKSLDVRPGAWIQEIIKGNDVTLENNKFVQQQQQKSQNFIYLFIRIL